MNKKNQANEKNYRNKITLLSFVLAILVVTIHAENLSVYSIDSGALFWIEKYENTFATIAVPTFFALSAYLFFQNYSPDKLLSKWKGRVFSILIPYLIWNGIAYLFYQSINCLPFVQGKINQDLEPFSFLGLLKDMVLGGHNVTWFLQNLMAYMIVTPLLYWFIKYRIGAAIVLAVAVIGAVLTNNSWVINFVIYLFGAIIGIHGKSIVRLKYQNYLIVLSGLYLFVTMLLLTLVEINTPLIMIPLRITQIMTAWIFADVFAVSYELKWWVKISFFIYCCHSMILESLEKVIFIVLGQNQLGAAIDFFFAPMITLAILFVMAAVLRKIKPLWRVLTGNRGSS